MIQVQCPHCGWKFTAPDGQAGRVSPCPECKGRIALPPSVASGPTVISDELLAAGPPPTDAAHARAPQEGRDTPAAAVSDALDRRLLDPPPSESSNARLSDAEILAKLKYQPPPEYTGARSLPWPIDVLLYPLNAPGLINLTIILGIPLLLTVLQHAVFLPFLGLMFLLAKLAVAIYAAWYWAECACDSAKGGTRAPQILDAAGYADKWSRVSYLLAVYILFVVPAVLYPMYGGRNTAILCLLLVWAVLFFPMGLLAMIMQDRLYVLNPLFLLGSIRRTFLPYMGLLSVLAAVAVLSRLIFDLLAQRMPALGPAGLGLFPAGYLSLVAAHILGRFYWRYRAQLGWDF
jgi:hypothetical protein